jgi:hypothetical protein
MNFEIFEKKFGTKISIFYNFEIPKLPEDPVSGTWFYLSFFNGTKLNIKILKNVSKNMIFRPVQIP